MLKKVGWRVWVWGDRCGEGGGSQSGGRGYTPPTPHSLLRLLMTCTCILRRASCAHACLVGEQCLLVGSNVWSSGRCGTLMTSSRGFNVDGHSGVQHHVTVSNDGRWVFVWAVSGRMMGWMIGVQGV